jgi:short-subunit dehydrogenase
MILRDKVIWITGASSGIGRELALQLAQKDATLILSARRLDALEDVRNACAHPERHLCLPFDLANVTEIEAIVPHAFALFDRIDILVNNAGVSQRSKALETPLTVDRAIMEVNYFGTVALTKSVAHRMVELRQGQIVAIASVAGKIGSPLRSAYSAAKHALIGFMDCLRAELYQTGVTVHVICPGFVQTDVSQNALTATGKPYGHSDPEIEHGMPVDQFVRCMIRRLERGTLEIVIARKRAWLGYQVRRLLPNTYHRVLPRFYHRSPSH